LSYGSRNGKGRRTLGDGPLRDAHREALLRTKLLIQPLGEGTKVRTCLMKSRILLEQLVDRLAAMLVCISRWLVNVHKPLRPFY
jgi:hypothetical protein